MPTRVTMVCSGNICRSPIAEIVLRKLLADAGVAGVEVTSSGMGGWHVGEGADHRTVQVLHRHGYDGSAHVASRFDRSSFGDLDLVLAADRGHVRELHAVAGTGENRAKVRLLREFDPIARDGGAKVLAELLDPESFTELNRTSPLKYASQKLVQETRRKAVAALERLGRAEDRPLLEALARDDADPIVREAAMRAVQAK